MPETVVGDFTGWTSRVEPPMTVLCCTRSVLPWYLSLQFVNGLWRRNLDSKGFDLRSMSTLLLLSMLLFTWNITPTKPRKVWMVWRQVWDLASHCIVTSTVCDTDLRSDERDAARTLGPFRFDCDQQQVQVFLWMLLLWLGRMLRCCRSTSHLRGI